ncbi:hypothetical protein TorRG33x02_151400, partial [Trema orientale]
GVMHIFYWNQLMESSRKKSLFGLVLVFFFFSESQISPSFENQRRETAEQRLKKMADWE